MTDEEMLTRKCDECNVVIDADTGATACQCECHECMAPMLDRCIWAPGYPVHETWEQAPAGAPAEHADQTPVAWPLSSTEYTDEGGSVQQIIEHWEETVAAEKDGCDWECHSDDDGVPQGSDPDEEQYAVIVHRTVGSGALVTVAAEAEQPQQYDRDNEAYATARHGELHQIAVAPQCPDAQRHPDQVSRDCDAQEPQGAPDLAALRSITIESLQSIPPSPQAANTTQYGVYTPLIATQVVQGPQDETTASEANDVESHPGPQCSICGKQVAVHSTQHVYTNETMLHCSELCQAEADVALHKELNAHMFHTYCKELNKHSTALGLNAAPGTVAADTQLRAICIKTLLPIKQKLIGLTKRLLSTICDFTIQELKSNDYEAKKAIRKQINQVGFYAATTRPVHEVITIHGEMAVAVLKLHITDPKQISLRRDLHMLEKETQAKLKGLHPRRKLDPRGGLPSEFPDYVVWNHWIHTPKENELDHLIGNQQGVLASTASPSKIMHLPSDILKRIMGFKICAKEHEQLILTHAQDNWEMQDVGLVAHNIRQWILKQLVVHISARHRRLYIYLLDSILAVITCLSIQHGTNLVHELRDRISKAQGSCCVEKLNKAVTWLSALHYRVRALSVSQSHAQDITKQQYLSLVCRSLKHLVTAKRSLQYMLKVRNAYAVCRPDTQVSALWAASRYLNRWEAAGKYDCYSKVKIIASWQKGGLTNGSGMANETHHLWCKSQPNTVSPCVLSMQPRPAMLTIEQMYAQMFRATGNRLYLHHFEPVYHFEPMLPLITTDHIPGPQDNTTSSEAEDVEHQPGPFSSLSDDTYHGYHGHDCLTMSTGLRLPRDHSLTCPAVDRGAMCYARHAQASTKLDNVLCSPRPSHQKTANFAMCYARHAQAGTGHASRQSTTSDYNYMKEPDSSSNTSTGSGTGSGMTTANNHESERLLDKVVSRVKPRRNNRTTASEYYDVESHPGPYASFLAGNMLRQAIADELSSTRQSLDEDRLEYTSPSAVKANIAVRCDDNLSSSAASINIERLRSFTLALPAKAITMEKRATLVQFCDTAIMLKMNWDIKHLHPCEQMHEGWTSYGLQQCCSRAKANCEQTAIKVTQAVMLWSTARSQVKELLNITKIVLVCKTWCKEIMTAFGQVHQSIKAAAFNLEIGEFPEVRVGGRCPGAAISEAKFQLLIVGFRTHNAQHHPRLSDTQRYLQDMKDCWLHKATSIMASSDWSSEKQWSALEYSDKQLETAPNYWCHHLEIHRDL